MPIYEFQCTSCREVFEDTVPVGQRTHKCPHCGGKAKKMISSVGIIFKGSGFYCTDNRSGNGDKKKESKGKAKSQTKESKKTSTVDKPKGDE
jgi:putative FmdB family regulatory protein